VCGGVQFEINKYGKYPLRRKSHCRNEDRRIKDY
ncbi:unnamed protein product, partial [Rotaria magnacalcarata]